MKIGIWLGDALTTSQDAHCSMSDELWHQFRQESGIRHSRYQGKANVLGAVAARRALPIDAASGGELAVLAVGGPQHLKVAWSLTQTICDEGPELLSPISFPFSIPSASAVAIAAALGAKAGAWSIGYDELAVWEAVATSACMLRANAAAGVVVVGALIPDLIANQVCDAVQRPHLATIAKAAYIAPVHSTEPDLYLDQVRQSSRETTCSRLQISATPSLVPPQKDALTVTGLAWIAAAAKMNNLSETEITAMIGVRRATLRLRQPHTRRVDLS